MAIAFVLHGASDQHYAAALAGALAPAIALPTPFPQRDGAQFGSGAACIVVWSANAGAEAHDVCGALARCHANVVVSCIGPVAVPAEFASAQFLVLEGTGDAVQDVTRIREAIADIDERLAAPNALKLSRLASPSLNSLAAPVTEKADKRMAVRSAYGLAATLAVVGFMAPSIGQRAVATGIDHAAAGRPQIAPQSAAPTPTQSQAPALPSAPASLQHVSVVANPDSPLVDHWLAPPTTFAAERLEAPDAAALIDYVLPSDMTTITNVAPDRHVAFFDGLRSLFEQHGSTEAAAGDAPISDRGETRASLDGAALTHSFDLKRNN